MLCNLQIYGDKRFLFDIVANGRNGIDVDKCVLHLLASKLLLSVLEFSLKCYFPFQV